MELTDSLVRELQIKLTLKVLPVVIKNLCSGPEGVLAELLLANTDGVDIDAQRLLQKLDDGLQWFGNEVNNDLWLKQSLLECCGKQTSKNMDQQKSLLAEINAYLQLSFCFREQTVEQLDENGGKVGKTPDFKVGDNLYVEVYCPNESDDHKKVVSSLAKKSNKHNSVELKTVITRPVTGNTELAKKYASNQSLTRIVSAKRANDQTVDDAYNILWLNLSNKLRLNITNVLPVKSVSIGNDNFLGANGIWHSFYGVKEKSVFAFEHHSLRFPCDSNHYLQKKHEGLFRERLTLSAAIVECTDGIVIYQNPWSDQKLDKQIVISLSRLYGFKPELSWLDVLNSSCLSNLVDAELEKHDFLIIQAE